MVRLLKRADILIGGLAWRDHCRAAKKRTRKIQFTRDRRKHVHLYRELIAIASTTLAYLDRRASAWLSRKSLYRTLADRGPSYRPLIERPSTQSERCVLAGKVRDTKSPFAAPQGLSSKIYQNAQTRRLITHALSGTIDGYVGDHVVASG